MIAPPETASNSLEAAPALENWQPARAHRACVENDVFQWSKLGKNLSILSCEPKRVSFPMKDPEAKFSQSLCKVCMVQPSKFLQYIRCVTGPRMHGNRVVL